MGEAITYALQAIISLLLWFGILPKGAASDIAEAFNGTMALWKPVLSKHTNWFSIRVDGDSGGHNG